jgi:hypothetical protein
MVLTIILIVAGSIVLLAAVFLVVILWLRGAVARRLEEATAELGEDGIIKSEPAANSFGFLSQPMTQVRGNGTLILTSQAIEFFMLVPKKRVSVPLERITGLDNPMWWRGKSVASRLFGVYFKDVSDEDDGIAFWVKDTDSWLAETADAMAAAGLAPAGKPGVDT